MPRVAPVKPMGINHLVLNVRNMEESHHFWCELLGFEHVGTLDSEHKMQFYGTMHEGQLHHHDFALAEVPSLPEPAEEWSMFGGTSAIGHIAITYPDRESWLEQVEFLKEQGVPMNLRLDHGMTHSLYTNDPNGYGVEVLYELPREVWEHDINGALNHAVAYPDDQLLEDNTDYTTEFLPRDRDRDNA